MIPTVDQIKTRTLSLVDDDSQEWATNGKFQEAFSEGYDVMISEMLKNQIPRLKNATQYTLTAATTSLTPAAVGIGDFGELIKMQERNVGSTDQYADLMEWDILPVRPMADWLADFVWRQDTFYFVGANTSRDLLLHYYSSGQAPASGSVGVDGSMVFLSRYAANVLLDRHGQERMAARYRVLAVGPRYEEGVLGGDLFSLISPMVRSINRTPLEPRPFTLYSTGFRQRMPVIITAQGASSTNIPMSFSSSASTIIGTIDGSNATFYVSAPLRNAAVYLNGIRLTENLHYAWATNVVTFYYPMVPQPGQDILIEGFQ